MKRIAVFTLLAVLHVTGSMPVAAQTKGAVPYGHQTAKQAEKAAEKQQKQFEKAARKQQRNLQKYDAKQRKAAKKANKHATKNTTHHS
jgi:hypothetical protein